MDTFRKLMLEKKSFFKRGLTSLKLSLEAASLLPYNHSATCVS